MKEYFAYQWHITDYCDQRCKHCYIFSDNKDLKLLETPYPQIEKTLMMIEDMCAKENKIPYIYLTGGDPILHSKFWLILELFKKHNNATFKQYVNYERIKKATTLIEDTDMLIKEIAGLVGFTDSLYFSKLFKKYRLVSPENYRLSLKKRSIMQNKSR